MDIYILGLGQRFPCHLTLEVMEVLDDYEVVYTLLTEDEIARLPADLAAKCQSVFNRYRPDRLRWENYAEVSKTILEVARRLSPLAWLTWGNPRVLDNVSQTLIDIGQAEGFSVVALPAVSTIDTVLVDVGYDPAAGLLVIEATSAVLYQTPLVPEVATLVVPARRFRDAISPTDR